MSHYRCSTCDQSGHNRLNCPLVYTVKRRVTQSKWSETVALREAIWEQLSFLFPKPTCDLYREVTDEWGDIGRRRFQRALSWLKANRPIVVREVELEETTTIGYMRRVA